MVKKVKQARFGDVDGVVEGQKFASHDEMYALDVHRKRGSGISGKRESGADSIILSGGYAGDRIEGDEVIYTGEGGMDRDLSRQVEDQSFESPGNAGLVVSQLEQLPVRVIEGLKIRGRKRPKATGGYRYLGLYKVVDSWQTVGQEGFLLCQFRLIKEGKEGTSDAAKAPTTEPAETELEKRFRIYLKNSRVRDSKIVAQVKAFYNDTCQVCQERMKVSPAGEAYSEAAHIQALGRPHEGPDVIGNVLCLCSNCHVRFDRGVYYLTDDLDVCDRLEEKVLGPLTVIPEHAIELRYVHQHRNRWAPLPDSLA